MASCGVQQRQCSCAKDQNPWTHRPPKTANSISNREHSFRQSDTKASSFMGEGGGTRASRGTRIQQRQRPRNDITLASFLPVSRQLWSAALSTVREVTYQLLRELGATVIFGNPGSTELPFLRDMPADFKYVLGLHERAAAGMAIGYALGTGRAAFANLHSIASSGNALSSLVDAWHGHIPVVVTTGQQDRRQLLAEAFLSSHAVETVKPYVKWAHEPVRAEDVPAAIARGFYLAMQPPMGPVFLSIPMDDWTHACSPLNIREISAPASPDKDALAEVAAE